MVGSPITKPLGSVTAYNGPAPESYPYRRGVTCVLRGFFGTLAAAMLALAIALMTLDGLGDKIPKTAFVAPIVTFALSFVINFFALISAILRRYGPKGHWKVLVFLDLIVFALAIWGYVSLSIRVDNDVHPEMTTDNFGKPKLDETKPMLGGLLADVCLVVGVLHLAAAIGGLWGFMLVSLRRKAYENKGTPHFTGVKLFAWLNPVSSGGVAHTGYPEPGN